MIRVVNTGCTGPFIDLKRRIPCHVALDQRLLMDGDGITGARAAAWSGVSLGGGCAQGLRQRLGIRVTILGPLGETALPQRIEGRGQLRPQRARRRWRFAHVRQHHVHYPAAGLAPLPSVSVKYG